MKTKDTFPRTCAWLEQVVPDFALAFGGPELDWTRDDSTERVRNALVFAQQIFSEGNLDRLTELTTHILQDILALRQTSTPAEMLVLNFLQIDTSVTVMGTALVQKRLQLIFDWAIYSISDDFPFAHETNFQLSRLEDLFTRSSPSLYAALGRSVALEWIRIFYYYVFKVGGLKELARLMAPSAIARLSSMLPAPDAIEPSLRIAEWSVRAQYPTREPFLRKLAQTFVNSHPGSQVHFSLGMSFALLIGRDCGIDTKSFGRMMLKMYKGNLPPSWELQLLQAALVPDPADIIQSLGAVIDCIRRYRQETLSVMRDSILVEYEFERSFTLVSAIIVSLLKAGQSGVAAQVIAEWKGLPADSARQDVLFALPNEAEGLRYSRENAVYSAESPNSADSFMELVAAINNFHGTNIVLEDDDSLRPHVPARPGLPDAPIESSSSEYLRSMQRQFCLLQQEARSFLEETRRGNSGAIRFLTGLPCPLQAVMINALGFSWPIASTMRKPEADRRCRRALIWTGGTLIDEQQAHWIVDTLGPHVHVTIAAGNKERFRSEFTDAEYDVIWITTHGEFDHMDPHRSRLTICEGTELTFEDISRIPIPQQCRRLLILDACDSGAVPVYGGLSDLGFGPLLASAHQAIICHRWPVEQYASALFNVVLAYSLRSKRFYEAYECAVAVLIQGKDRTVEELASALGPDHDLIRRIQNSESIRWDTLFFWGSPAFLE
jgi:hypothetical protein